MNNEEKILGTLDTISNRLDSIDKRFDSIDKRFDKLESDVGSLKTNYERLNRSVSVIENTSVKHVQIIKEGHKALEEKLDRLIGRPPIDERVETLEYTVSVHTDVLKKLRQENA